MLKRIKIGEAFQINPKVTIEKGQVVPFVSMDQLMPRQGRVSACEARAFKGGSKFQHGDTLMARITPCLENGKTARYFSVDIDQPAAGSTEFIVLRGKDGFSSTPFAYYFATSPDIRELSISLMTGTSGRQRVDVNAFKDSEVLLPSLTVQRDIASVLGALDEKIAANRSTEMAARQLVVERWSKLVMDSAPAVELQDIVDINPSTPKPSRGLQPFLEMKNLPSGRMNVQEWGYKDAKSGVRFMNDDTLLARITPCFENGKTAFVDFLQDEEVGVGSTEYIVLRPKGNTPRAAVYCIAISDSFRMYAAQSMTGTSGRQRVLVDALKEYRLPWRDVDSLQEFESFSDSILYMLKGIRDENQTLAKTRDELLPLLMSGKITVRDAEDAAAEVGVEKREEEGNV